MFMTTPTPTHLQTHTQPSPSPPPTCESEQLVLCVGQQLLGLVAEALGPLPGLLHHPGLGVHPLLHLLELIRQLALQDLGRGRTQGTGRHGWSRERHRASGGE